MLIIFEPFLLPSEGKEKTRRAKIGNGNDLVWRSGFEPCAASLFDSPTLILCQGWRSC